MARSESDKKKLGDEAEKLTAHKQGIQIDDHEITGENKGKGAFPIERAPNVCAVVVDKHSERRFVEITGGGFPDQTINTCPREIGSEETRFIMAEIRAKQGCMIYGSSTLRGSLFDDMGKQLLACISRVEYLNAWSIRRAKISSQLTATSKNHTREVVVPKACFFHDIRSRSRKDLPAADFLQFEKGPSRSKLVVKSIDNKGSVTLVQRPT